MLRAADGSGDGGPGEVAGGPGGLEVEAAGDAVDVQDFAGEVEAGDLFALHRFELEVIERDSAAGHEFIFVEALAIDDESGFDEFADECRTLILGEGGPGGVVGDFGGFTHAVPEAFRDAFDEAAFHDLPDAILFTMSIEDEGDAFGGFAAGPVDLDLEAVIAIGEVAGTPGGGL